MGIWFKYGCILKYCGDLMRLNTDIINFIKNNNDFDDDIKTFLIQSLTLELKRYKADYKRFSEDYDKLISRYVVNNDKK